MQHLAVPRVVANTRVLLSCGLSAWLGTAACNDPYPIDATRHEVPVEEEEICAASGEWLPDTPPLDLFKPLPHPASECPFYRGGWQNFLIATQPDAAGVPALRGYPTVDDLFDSSKPKAAERAWLGDIKQAGGRQILIDQNGNPIYYGIHVNRAFADFIDGHQLRTKAGIVNADPRLFFPAGVVEFKSAWQIVEAGEGSDDYITVAATVPTLSQDPVSHEMREDRNRPRPVNARLLALHVVFTLPGHPEFIWATFEHVDGEGKGNIAPRAAVNPARADPNNLDNHAVVSVDQGLLFKAGTTADSGNQAIAETELLFDAATQRFPGQQTSIYRMFPASKSNTVHPDDAITSLNANVTALFERATAQGTLGALDRRAHYRLVGAVWMDKPENFAGNIPLQNDETSPFAHEPKFLESLQEEGSDSEFSILAGEDRLSSTAMESFTQAPDAFPNCFSCHNTQAVTAKGVPLNKDQSGVMLLGPKLLNVSHVLTQFVLEETE
jgi:hypothetical protein